MIWWFGDFGLNCGVWVAVDRNSRVLVFGGISLAMVVFWALLTLVLDLISAWSLLFCGFGVSAICGFGWFVGFGPELWCLVWGNAISCECGFG